MLSPFKFLLLLPVISSICSAAIDPIKPRQMQSRGFLNATFSSTSNNSATTNSTQTQNSSHTSFQQTYTYFHDSSITALPTPLVPNDYDGYGPYAKKKDLKNYMDIKSGFCDLSDNFCSFKDYNGTIKEASPIKLDDVCVLWDSSCSGNKTLAIEKFFSIAFPDKNDAHTNLRITNNDCFAQPDWISQSDCVTFNPPDRLLAWQKMKDWMRSEQCVSDAEEYQNMTGHQWGFILEGGVNESYSDWHQLYGPSAPGPSCCSFCELSAQNVDIYYWPDPDANSSCLSTIGGSVRPLNYGGTIIDSTTYWACPAFTDPVYPDITITDLTTAVVKTIGELSVKVPLYNPWHSVPCPEDDTGSQGSNRSINTRDEYASIRPRDHSLIIPSSITHKNDVQVSTVVSGSFTL